jgi:osomolarity two-component system, response regulator SKN7
MLNSQLVATQQQVTSLQDRNSELIIQNGALHNEVVALKTFVVNHEQVLQYLVNAIIGDFDARKRRQSRGMFPGATGDVTGNTMAATASPLQAPFDEEAPPSPLLHASKLLSETNMDLLMNNTRALDQTSALLTSPTPDLTNGRTSTGSTGPPSAGSSEGMRFGELDTLVYPVGHTNGIDPMFGEHVNNIPYNMPVSRAPDTAPLVGMPPSGHQGRKANIPDPGWMRQPQILLVEDDATCRKIGSKFLAAFSCSITFAV